MNISATRSLFAYDNGDTITPAMGVEIAAGNGLSQFWDSDKNEVIATDFKKVNAKLFPQPFSSRQGIVIVPESGDWLYNSPSGTPLTFDANGKCTTAGLTTIFELTEVVSNGKTFPALKIVDNLATAADHTDKYIYYKGVYKSLNFTCQQLIPIQSASTADCDILISCQGPGNVDGDNILSNGVDYVKMIPYLQRAGKNITSGVTYTWQRLVNGTWTNVSNVSGQTVINNTDHSLTVYEAAVYGTEHFRCVAVCDGKTYYKVQEVSDIQDPYYIVDGCTATDSLQPGETAKFTPVVYNRANNVRDTGHTWTFTYTVYRMPEGTVFKTGSGATFNLTYDDIESAGGKVSVRINATCPDA